jgi:hypothetical protein
MMPLQCKLVFELDSPLPMMKRNASLPPVRQLFARGASARGTIRDRRSVLKTQSEPKFSSNYEYEKAGGMRRVLW